jgi:predicted amidohydrolase YtcJ
MGSAIANGDDQHRGSIEAGKFADFIVMDKNPLSVSSGELASVKVKSTFIGGKQAFNLH